MGKGAGHPDGVETYPANQADLQSYERAAADMRQMQVPVLVSRERAHERLFVATQDGTGNHMRKDDRENWTNVAAIRDQLEAAIDKGANHIGVGYVEGPGTQDNAVIRTHDLITGASFRSRVEEGYFQFIRQADRWIKADPNADIRFMAVGFSRGAEQAAALTRVVHERGVQDPTDAIYTHNSAGEITSVRYTRPALVPPGQVPQAVVLFDPVGAGEPSRHDRRLPASVLGGLQLSAEDELRDPFPSTNVISPGLSQDRRFLNSEVGGAHSNVGGSYRLNGLAHRSHHLAADYINAVAQEDLIPRRSLPPDAEMDVVHRSERHHWFYGTSDAHGNHGVRLRKDLLDARLCKADTECHSRDPMDPTLAAKVPTAPLGPVRSQAATEWVPDAPAQPAPATERTPPPAAPLSGTDQDIHDLFIRLTDPVMAGDRGQARACTQAYVASPDGQAWLQSGRDFNARQRLAAEQEAMRERELELEHEARVLSLRGPVMRR